MHRSYVAFIDLVIAILTLTSCGPGQLLGPTPTTTPTVAPTSTPTPTPPPISDADIAYFRGMLLNPEANEMLSLTPPTELSTLHYELVSKKQDEESALLLMQAAVWSDRLSFYQAQALWEAASETYETAEKQARQVWDHYLSRFGLALPAIYYSDVAFTAIDDGWIVGSKGLILHYDGQDWRPFESPTTGNLLDIYMAGRNEGWIVGAEGLLLHYSEKAWQVIPNPSGQTYIAKLSVLGPDDVWMLASDLDEEKPTIELLHYDGSNWSQVANRTGEGQLSDFRMLDSQTGWVAYEGGQQSLLFVNGAWRNASFDFDYDFQDIAAVQLLSSSSGWAVGDDGRIFSFNGREWIETESPTEEYLTDLVMIDASEGWVVGAEGTILHYDGTRWSKVSSPTQSYLFSVDMFGPDIGWIQGGDHTILRFNGSKWATDNFPLKQGIFDQPAVVSPDNVWAISSLNGIVHFDGASWEVLYQWPEMVH